MSTPPGPTLGPCVAWCSGEDIALCRGDTTASEFSRFDGVAVEASMVLFELSGRQFSGLCSQTVRPCRLDCGCTWWLPSDVALPTWGWWPGSIYGWGWGFDGGSRSCGCQPESRVKLAGYPVRAITEVKIDGVVLAELDIDGDRNWRLDGWRWLTRMDKPGTPGDVRRWPGCQNLSLDDDQPGTFAVSYEFGVSPPPLGVSAAAQLASELFNACDVDAECALPERVTKVVRQGVTMDRVITAATALRAGNSGIELVDAFIAGYGNDTRRRPAVFSPDVQRFARRVGT